MKNKYFFGSILTVLLFSTLCVNAQRPVWLVGHRCNSQKSLQEVLVDGGNGVEIDVRTPNEGKFWCVDHGYTWSQTSCDGVNHLSLAQYLALPELKNEQFCLLWIDCKHSYVKELVEYVHANIPANIKGKFAIAYCRYNLSDLDYYVTDASGYHMHILQWLKENLWPNEGIGLAWERASNIAFKNLLDQHSFPYEKHFFTDGTWHSKKVTYGSRWAQSLRLASSYRDAKNFCSRVGFWSASTAYDAYWFFDRSYGNTNCDVVLAECRETVHIPFCSPTALKYCKQDYLDKHQDKFRMAKRDDKFFAFPR